MAVDKAGNERIVGFSYHVNARTFPQGPDLGRASSSSKRKCLNSRGSFPRPPTSCSCFSRSIGDMRRQNVQRCWTSAGRPPSGPSGTAFSCACPMRRPRGNFAQARTYRYDGKEIDHATHLGIDLASLAQLPAGGQSRPGCFCRLSRHLRQLPDHRSWPRLADPLRAPEPDGGQGGPDVEKGRRSPAAALREWPAATICILAYWCTGSRSCRWSGGTQHWITDNVTGKWKDIPGAHAP